MSAHSVSRYSDHELAEFRALIDKKLASARESHGALVEQIENLTESFEEEGDWMDDTVNHADFEMLQSMAVRQLKHIRDLENAHIRIQNKTYGICVVTGELIDKRRLMAVPTTTKSIAAKTAVPVAPVLADDDEDDDSDEAKPKKKSEPKIITKIIRRPTAAPAAAPQSKDDDDDDADPADDSYFDDAAYDDDYDDSSQEEEEVDFDDIADPSSIDL